MASQSRPQAISRSIVITDYDSAEALRPEAHLNLAREGEIAFCHMIYARDEQHATSMKYDSPEQLRSTAAVLLAAAEEWEASSLAPHGNRHQP